jgi:plastocyanin
MINTLKTRLLTFGVGMVVAQWAAGAGALAVTKTVRIENFRFVPATVTIAAGDTVRWVWAGGTHSTTSGACTQSACSVDGIWDSGIRSSGEFTHTFDTPGSFPYHCRVHLAAMTGTVVVGQPAPLAAAASGSPTCGGPAPIDVAFQGDATGGMGPYSFLWDFGDNSTSTEQNPVHNYATSGTYTATLQATDADGTMDATTVPIDARSVAVPMITKMRMLSGPFRLAIFGTGFGPHSTVLINDQPVPGVKFVKSTKLIAMKGAALQAMLPMNQDVSITVRDNDTNVTGCPFTFMRMRHQAGGGGMGGGGY